MDNIGRAFKASLLKVNGVKDASIGKRFLSFIIDLLVLNILLSPFGDLLMGLTKNLSWNLPDFVYTVVVFMSFIALFYFSLFQAMFSQTIGMMVMRIKVVPGAGFWRCVVRNIFILPFFPFNLLWIFEPFHLYFKKVRILEIISKTRTVESVK